MRKLSEQVARIVKSTRGARDLRIERLSGQQELTIDIDRRAIARHGLNVADVNELIATAIGGKAVTQVFEGERRFTLLLRFPSVFVDDVEAIRDLLLRPPGNAGPEGLMARGGVLVPLVRSRISRSLMVRRSFRVSMPNAAWWSAPTCMSATLAVSLPNYRNAPAKEIKLPPGYYFVWGGQFENMERAMATLA